MDRQQLLTTVVGTTLLGSALVMTARSDTDPTARTAEPSPRRVEVATVEKTQTTRTVRLAGITRAADRAQLSFPVPARLATRPAEVGDRVTAGQVLASLDDREFQIARQAAGAALAELEVRLAQAVREEERTVRLAAAEAATAEELEQTGAAASALAAARDAAAARLAETNRLVDESTLEAPFSGTVTAVHVEPGEWASPGRPVVELAGNGAVEVVVEAPESAWSRLAAGLPVTVSLPFVGVETGGVIRRVASVAMGPGGLFPVEVAVDRTPGLAAGLAAEVLLPLEPISDLTVPLEAVLNPGSSRPAVFRIVDGRAERVLVTVGQVTGDRISVKGALADGDLVAVAGHTALAESDPVEVL